MNTLKISFTNFIILLFKFQKPRVKLERGMLRARPRAGDFIVKQAEDDGHILGYSVIRINRNRRDYPVGYFSDLLTLPDRLDVAEVLVAEAIKYFDSNNINIISCLVIKNHPYEKIFKRYGFINSRQRMNLFYQPYATIDDEIKKFKISPSQMTHFVYGDKDVA